LFTISYFPALFVPVPDLPLFLGSKAARGFPARTASAPELNPGSPDPGHSRFQQQDRAWVISSWDVIKHEATPTADAIVSSCPHRPCVFHGFWERLGQTEKGKNVAGFWPQMKTSDTFN